MSKKDEQTWSNDDLKGDYFQWKLSKTRTWLHKATHSANDFGLRSAYYAGYAKAKGERK